MIFDISKENKNKSGVYKITNIVNKKFYIGSAKDFKKRFRSHLFNFKFGKINRYLYRAGKKYGISNFYMSMVELCPIENLLEREQYYLDFLKPYNRNIGYNILPKSYNNSGLKWSKKSKDRHSKNYIEKIGRYFEVEDKDGNIFKGRGITKFAREHGLDDANFKAVLDGKFKTHKGWHLIGYKGKLDYYKFTYPSIFKFKDSYENIFKIENKKLNQFLKSKRWGKQNFISWYMGKSEKYRNLIKLGESDDV
jgi:group I intron endonuclease